MMDVTGASLPRTFALMLKAKKEGIFVWTWCTIITCLIVGRGSPPLVPAALSVVAMFLLSISVYFYNDVIDQEMDRLNPIKKSRPLSSNIVSEGDVMKLVYLFAFMGLAVSFTLNLYSFMFSLVYLVVFSLYSHPGVRLKNRFLMKDLVIFSGFPLCSLVGSYAVINELSMPALFSGFLFAIYSSSVNPIFGDSLDMEEDALFGVKNLALVLSWRRKVQLMVFGVLFLMTVTPLTYAQLGFNTILPIFTVLFSLIFLRLMFPIMGAFERAEVMKVRKWVYGYLIAFQLLVIIGSLNINFWFV